jgi:hypothetical protein
MSKHTIRNILLTALLCGISTNAFAHGIVGNRLFPSTLTIDDPAVADEMTLPQVQSFKEKQDDGSYTWVNHTSAEYSKRITKEFGISIGGDYISSRGNDTNTRSNGFDNFSALAKYQFITNVPHELIASFGVDTDIGGTGAKHIGVESYSTFTPNFYFGKGMGDLPDSVSYLQPFAITGVVGVAMPMQDHSTDLTTGDITRNADMLNYGFSIQYSVPYLQQHVKDIGLTAPFNSLIPLVEFNMQAPIDRGSSRLTTGTISPGFIWVGKETQIGLEAMIPVNNESGRGVGAVAQMHFYMDDLFPKSIGKPLLGN